METPKYRLSCITTSQETSELLERKLRPTKTKPKLRRTDGPKQNGRSFGSSYRTCSETFIRFKLHLRPKLTSSASVTKKIPPLPKGKTAVQVFADFLKYLHKCSQKYIEETQIAGSVLWQNLESTTEYVLSHPNGWEGGQQTLMREAAMKAGLIPDTEDGRSRLSFVTEGEASLHYCIQNGLTAETNKVRYFISYTESIL